MKMYLRKGSLALFRMIKLPGTAVEFIRPGHVVLTCCSAATQVKSKTGSL